MYYFHNSFMFPASDYHLLNRVSSIFFLLIQCMLWEKIKKRKKRQEGTLIKWKARPSKSQKKVRSLFILGSIMPP